MYDTEQTNRTDSEHLRILAIMHYVFGALTAFGSLGGMIFILAGSQISMISEAAGGGQNDLLGPGATVSFIGLCVVIVFVAIGAAIAFAGYCLSRSQAYVYCFVIAVLECLSMPLGTVLGVFTIIVLSRDSVKARFAGYSDTD